jgi:hypothetical protein
MEQFMKIQPCPHSNISAALDTAVRLLAEPPEVERDVNMFYYSK